VQVLSFGEELSQRDNQRGIFLRAGNDLNNGCIIWELLGWLCGARRFPHIALYQESV